MDVSVILTIYEEEQIGLLKKCVESLVSQKYKGDYEIVIIAENVILEDKMFQKEMIKISSVGETSGLSEARNLGADEANGDYLLFLDSDCIASQELLSNYMRRKPDLGGGPAIPIWEASWISRRPRRIPEEFFWLVGCSNLEFDEENARPYGCNFFVKSNLFEKLGGFRESLGKSHGFNLQGEDAEFCERARVKESIKPEYVTEASVRHLVEEYQTSYPWLFKRAFMQGVSKSIIENLHSESLSTEGSYLGYLFKKIFKTRPKTEDLFIVLYVALIGTGYIYGKINPKFNIDGTE